MITREEALELIRKQTMLTKDRHSYLPKSLDECYEFQPHEWIIELVISVGEFMDEVHSS